RRGSPLEAYWTGSLQAVAEYLNERSGDPAALAVMQVQLDRLDAASAALESALARMGSSVEAAGGAATSPAKKYADSNEIALKAVIYACSPRPDWIKSQYPFFGPERPS